jgi:uncharacterized iron-regulated membrane protein
MSSGARRRPVAYLVHSVLGFQLSLFVTFVCLTGTLAVVSDDLEWLYRPEVRATAGGGRVSWQVQYDAAKAAFPDHTIDYANVGEEPYLATKFSATAPSGEMRFLYVDPGSGRVLGDAGWINLPTFLRGLHTYLFVPGDSGFYVVTSLGFLLAGSLVSGLLVYKRFWRGLFRAPRLRRNRRVAWGDVHRLASVWSIWFVFVMAGTSVWYFAERALYRAGVDFDRARVNIDAASLDRLGPSAPKPLPLDDLVRIATTRLPGLEPRELWFPIEPSESLAVLGQASAMLVRDRANGVDVDPFTGEILAVHQAKGSGALARWTHTADPLHFGDFGGLVSKLVWALFGVLLCLTAASGAFVYLHRTNMAARDMAGGFARSRPRLVRGLSMAWIAINCSLVFAVPVLAFVLSWQPDFAPPPPVSLALGPSAVADLEVTATTADSVVPGAEMQWNLRVCRDCYFLIRTASMGLAAGGEPPARMEIVTGGANAASARLPVPALAPNQPLYLWVEVRGWDGRDHRVSWQVPT